MSRFAAIIIACTGFVLCTLAHGQVIVLKDNTKLGPNQFEFSNGKILKIVKIGDNVAKSELQLAQVARLEFPTPTELTEGTNLLAGGKTDEALELLLKGRDMFAAVKDIPGSYYNDLAFAYVEALSQAGKFDEATKPMIALRALKLSDAQKTRLKILQLNSDRQTNPDASSIIAQAQNILSETDDSSVGAAIWMIQGDVYLKQKDYEKALFAYLRVPVFYGTQVQRVPEAELSAAACLSKMRRFEDAAMYYKRIMETYPGSAIATKAQTEEASIRGLKNDDDAAAKGAAKKDEAAKKDDSATPKEEKK